MARSLHDQIDDLARHYGLNVPKGNAFLYIDTPDDNGKIILAAYTLRSDKHYLPTPKNPYQFLIQHNWMGMVDWIEKYINDFNRLHSSPVKSDT